MVTVCGSDWTARKSFSNLVSFFSKRRERGPNSCQGRIGYHRSWGRSRKTRERRRNDRCRDIDDDGGLDTKRNRTRARACANPRLITSLTLFTTSTDLLSPFESIIFPQSEHWFQARLEIMAVLIAFSYVASFSQTCVYDRSSLHDFAPNHRNIIAYRDEKERNMILITVRKIFSSEWPEIYGYLLDRSY